MKRLKVLSEGVLYRNPTPDTRVESAYHPAVVPLSETEGICFYRVSTALHTLDGRLAKVRSHDGGRAWTADGLVWDPADDSVPHSYSLPHATRLSDGEMVLVSHRRPVTAVVRPAFDPETGGRSPDEIALFRSVDDGRTWSAPETLALPGDGLVDTPSHIIELSSGRWFLACERWKGRGESGPFHIKGFAVFSDDRGKTWTGRLDFPGAADPEKMYSHSRYTRMRDGRLAAMHWTQEIGGAKELGIHISFSDETATRWSHPRPTGIDGQSSWLADLGGGLVVAPYTVREGSRPGVRVLLSGDEGTTWDVENEVTIWGGSAFMGDEHHPKYPASHDLAAFGKPNAARMPNDEIICSWWCTSGGVTHIRFAKVAVE